MTILILVRYVPPYWQGPLNWHNFLTLTFYFLKCIVFNWIFYHHFYLLCLKQRLYFMNLDRGYDTIIAFSFDVKYLIISQVDIPYWYLVTEEIDYDDELFLWYGWPVKGIYLYFQPGPLPEFLTIANLQHATSRIGICSEPEFRLCWMKLCSNDNHYTMAQQIT